MQLMCIQLLSFHNRADTYGDCLLLGSDSEHGLRDNKKQSWKKTFCVRVKIYLIFETFSI